VEQAGLLAWCASRAEESRTLLALFAVMIAASMPAAAQQQQKPNIL
jgi:hypothetical protein